MLTKMTGILSIALACLVGLAACGGGGAAGATAAVTTAAATEAVATETTAAAPAAQETTAAVTEAATEETQTEQFSYWIQKFEDWNMEYFQNQSDKYNELNRGYIADVQFMPGDVWTDQMTAAVASGSAPDGYTISYNNIVSAVTQGQLMPLDDLFPKAEIDDIHNNIRSMATVNGKLYSYPQLVEPSSVLYYRTDLFEQAGIAEPPKSWDEMIDVGKKLTTADIYGLEIGDFPSFGWCTWGIQYATAGHLAINDNWDAPIIDQRYKDLALYYKRLYDEKVVPEQAIAGYTDIAPFGTGQVAMQICGSWGVAGIINDFPDMADKFSVAPIPTQDGDQDKPTATNGGWTFAIDAMSSHPKAAADYIGYLLAEDPAVPAEFFAIAQYSKGATRKSVDDYISVNVGSNDAPWASKIAYVASRAIPEPVYPWDISVAVSTMFESVAINGENVDNAADACIETIKQVIENNSLPGTNPNK